MRTSLRATLLLLLVVTAAVAAPRQAGAADATFVDTSATATFQESITFNLVAEADSPIIEVALFWQPAGDPELQAAFPEVQPDRHVEVSHDVDTSAQYLPPGLDIVYHWRVTEQDGDVTESDPATLFYMDDGQDWRDLTDGLVTVYWYKGSESFARDVVDTANRGVGRLGEKFGIVASEPVRLIIYGDERAFNRALPPNSAEWIGGQAHPEWNLIVAEIDPDSSANSEIRRMVPHEISHLILHQATANPFNTAPNWLDEGLAVYNQETPDPRFQDTLEDAVADGKLIPVRALNSSFPTDPDQAILSYAESASIVTFIADDLGDDKLASLVAVFRDEVSYAEAVERSLGMTIDELDAQWKASLGYQGDAPPELNQPSASEDDELTRNELIGLIACTGVGALAGLALGILGVSRVRRLGRQRLG
ncbi:MAG TPA: peptidase MA family metallohydrolase [Thermomicrobiales bacterium]|nr:peptidase MA family metallohydrolase [Thermomicrobiales bacterium]